MTRKNSEWDADACAEIVIDEPSTNGAVNMQVREDELILKTWERCVLVDDDSEIRFQEQFAAYQFSENELKEYHQQSQTQEYQKRTQSMIEFGLKAGLIKKVTIY